MFRLFAHLSGASGCWNPTFDREISIEIGLMETVGSALTHYFDTLVLFL